MSEAGDYAEPSFLGTRPERPYVVYRDDGEPGQRVDGWMVLMAFVGMVDAAVAGWFGWELARGSGTAIHAVGAAISIYAAAGALVWGRKALKPNRRSKRHGENNHA